MAAHDPAAKSAHGLELRHSPLGAQENPKHVTGLVREVPVRQMVCSGPPAMRRPRPCPASRAWRTPALAAVDTRSAAL